MAETNKFPYEPHWMNRENGSVTVGPVPMPTQPPPTQRVHDLLNSSIEKIAQEWIDQLHGVQANAQALEGQLMGVVAQTKASIHKLHQLGQHIADEAERGRKVLDLVATGLEEINPPS